MAAVNVTVVGLGKLGASFGLAVRALNQRADKKHTFTVTGTDRLNTAIKAAVKLGAVDQEVSSIERAVEGADLVFLAVPYDMTLDVMAVVGPALKPGAVVMDAAPLKLPSIAWAEEHFRRDEEGSLAAYLVGVVPILSPAHVGESTEATEAAKADLFDDGLMIVSPAPSCPPEAVRLIADLSQLLGIKLHFVDPAEYDGMAAGMEGLPILMQLALFQSLSRSRSWVDMQWLGNTSFFLATYHLMERRPEALAKRLHHNRDSVLRRLDALLDSLGELREVLASGEEEVLAEHFDSAMQEFARWQTARIENRYSTEPPPVQDVRPAVSLLGGFGNLMPSARARREKREKRGSR